MRPERRIESISQRLLANEIATPMAPKNVSAKESRPADIRIELPTINAAVTMPMVARLALLSSWRAKVSISRISKRNATPSSVKRRAGAFPAPRA